MKISIVYERNKPNTLSGDSITVKTIYSSFDASEIDEVEKLLKEQISTGIVMEGRKDGKYFE